MSLDALVLFARAPEREAAAKRLPRAAGLFRGLIAAWLRAAGRDGAVAVIACEDADREALAAIAPEIPRQWVSQRGARFGERVAGAVEEVFGRGFGRVIVAAIDAPPPDALPFDRIPARGAVIAPSRDGGINFLGIARPEPELLRRLTPRKRNLLATCRAYLENVVLVEASIDIDAAESLVLARKDRAWRGWLCDAVIAHVKEVVNVLTISVTPRASRAPPLVATV